MKHILGIDPGPEFTGYCLVEAATMHPLEAGKIGARQLVLLASAWKHNKQYDFAISCESVRSQGGGHALKEEVFLTSERVGYFQCAAEFVLDVPFFSYTRPQIARSLCGGNFGDTAVYAAIQLRFGVPKEGNPWYILKGDTDRRSAFAAAVYHVDLQRYGGKK